MVYGFDNVLKNLNSYYQEKTTRLRESFSPTRPASSSSTETSASSAATSGYRTTNGSAEISSSSAFAQDFSRSFKNPEMSSNRGASDYGSSTSSTKIDHERTPTGEDEERVPGMSVTEFRRCGKELIDYMADYMESLHKRRVVPAIEPGYLRDLMPEQAPEKPESYERCIEDFERLIMPGVTHWQHPRFHAYFPAGNSWPSILGDMLSDMLGAMGFSWAACPAMTELETIVLDWFGRMIGLPEDFLPMTEGGRGGGVIQGSASECNFVSLLAARFEVMKELRQRFPFVEEGLLLSKLIAYCSKEAHSSVEKACMIGMVKLRILETDSRFRLRGETLRTAIQEDRNLGLIPFFVSTTLGTTSCCSFDVLSEIGPVCTANEVWLHVDAAYAGSALICPEFRHLAAGLEYAMSFNTNPNKFLLVNFDCSTMWVKDRYKLTQALVVDPLYLQHSWADKSIDYRHWGIPLSRRFRSLKLWFVIRMYGVEGLQEYIRRHVRLAKMFEQLIRADPVFEVVGDVILGLVCFRLRGSEEKNQALLTKLNASGRIHMVPASLNGRFVIRFCVCAENASERDITLAYEIISQMAQIVLHEPAENALVEEDEELELLDEHNNFDDELVSPSGERKESVGEISQSSASGGSRPPFERAASKDEMLAKKRGESLATKRSFLVRMVSDPKCYNPKIVRHLSMNYRKMSQDMQRDRALMKSMKPARQAREPMLSTSDEEELCAAVSQVGVQTPI